MTERETTVGVLGGARTASVDERGEIAPERAGWRLTWWIGADDRWRIASREVAVRQTRLEAMPVVRTAMRVPGGDAVQEVFGADDLAVVDIRNDSPAPFVVALVVVGASGVALHDNAVLVDGRPALLVGREPSRWAVAADGSTERVVTSGAASAGPFPARADRGARLVAAFLHPLAHRAALRAVIGLAPTGIEDLGVQLSALPTAETAARGWLALLGRGMRVELPDRELQRAVDAARADALLAGQAWMPSPNVVAALEDWGFDREAAAAWPRLRGRERRALGRRVAGASAWSDVEGTVARGGVTLLAAVRGALLAYDGVNLALAPGWPDAWKGLPLDVRDAPTRHGPVSFSVRWHGDRVALLWDVPRSVVVTAPRWDPSWSSNAPSGEALLAPFSR